MKAQNQQICEDFIAQKVEETLNAKGQIGRQYMACITGMWSHTFRFSIARPPFGNDAELCRWWMVGHDASRSAMEALRATK